MPAMPSSDLEQGAPSMNRRGFLGLATQALLWLSAAAGLVGLRRFLSYKEAEKLQVRFTLDPPSAYPPGSVTQIRDARAMLYQDGGGFFARSIICTHLGCTVNREGDIFLCPCHGSRFSSDGDQVLNGPASQPLKALLLELDGESRLVLDAATQVPPEWRLSV